MRLHVLGICISLALGASPTVYAVDEIQFNTDVLDVVDRENIDLSQFSRGGYIMPGTYSMVVHINKNDLPEQTVPFYAPADDPNGSRACVNKALTEQLGLKEAVMKDLTWWHQGECLDENSLPGMELRGEPPFGATVLNARKQETGIVNDGGSVYLSGINAGDTMTVHWSGSAQCEVRMPTPLPAEMLMNSLLLPCHPLGEQMLAYDGQSASEDALGAAQSTKQGRIALPPVLSDEKGMVF